MEKIDKNLLIDCSSQKEANKVFDYLESQGEKTSRTSFSFSRTRNHGDWYFIGYYNIHKAWTVAREGNSNFGNKIISAKEFLGKPEEKSLVGRWVKFLKRISNKCPVGSYDLITEDDPRSKIITLEKYKDCSRMRFRDGEIELMPEGWSPDVEEPVTSVKDDVIPEYVECIKVLEFHYGELGKIYKVENWNYPIGDCMLVGTTSGSTSRDRFKPSTKEAYDAQNKPVEDSSTFKLGDWVVITQDTTEKGKIGQILSKDPNNNQYWTISGMMHLYRDDQIRLALSHPTVLHNTTTKGFEPAFIAHSVIPIELPTIEKKPLIENVQSISVNLRTKKQINKLKF